MGSISDDLIACKKLKFINLSRNMFTNYIPSTIGRLSNLQTLKLHGNRLSGSIPKTIFDASQLEVLMLQSNRLTGSIPSYIGILQSLTTVTMSHNSLKGKIPKEIANLTKLEFLHFHENKLTGTAPIVNLTDETNINAYISDCGTSFMQCEFCSMCCNGKGKCQVQLKWKTPVQTFGFIFVSLLPFACILIFFGLSIAIDKGYLKGLKDKRSMTSIYSPSSVYCLVFSESIMGWFIYLLTAVMQSLALYLFLKKSNFHDKDTTWEFRYLCHEDSIDCDNKGTTSAFGWFMFAVALIYFLGADLVESTLQLRKAVVLFDSRLLISGFVIFFLTTLALFTSSIYNIALATSDTDLLTNAVILLFINEFDEQVMNLLRMMFPIWLRDRFEEVEQSMIKKNNHLGDRSDANHLGKIINVGLRISNEADNHNNYIRNLSTEIHEESYGKREKGKSEGRRIADNPERHKKGLNMLGLSTSSIC